MKNQGKKMIAALTLIFSLLVVVQANAFEIGARGYVWFPDLKKSDLQTIANGIEGSDINAKDMLGVGNKATFSVEAYGGVGKTISA